MLAKAVATECNTTFFNVSASTIVSKWRGNSEKLVRMLFELARHHAPATIFIDEIDSIMGQRRGRSEHEASRRMKTELLVQLDGLARASADGSERVFLLAASNLPWELDLALLRRLEKRVLVGVPEQGARALMLKKFLQPHGGDNLPDEVLEIAARRTHGFTGADLRLLCKEAAMRPLRTLLETLEAFDDEPPTANSTSSEGSIDPRALRPPSVKAEDLEAALAKVKPSTRSFESKYEEWTKAFGST
jgi:katanin p60 ATPase-containing subunit A1